jgi:hypothetical protein
LHKTVKDFVDNEQHRRHLKREHVSLIEAYLLSIDGHREETVNGRDRALAALREAMGAGPNASVEPVLKKLPVAAINAGATKEDIVALAVSQRGEVTQTATFAHVTCLEVQAQGRSFLPQLRTFASGSDIHAQPIPTGSNGFDYKPGALGEEMPTTITGHRNARMDQAEQYHARAEQVAEKTRNLIALEAENAYFQWKEAKVKAEKLMKAAVEADKHAKLVKKQFADAAQTGFSFDPAKEAMPPRVEDVLFSGFTATKMKIDANEAYFHYLLALAQLERVTCGGFCIAFQPAPEAGK